MGLYILIFEVFIIVMYGIFARTGTTTTSISDLQSSLYFTLAFALVSMKGRLYDWSMLMNYLFVLAICFQMNTLYLMFWDSAFNSGFSSNSTINSYYLIVNIECTLTVLVTIFVFLRTLNLPQIFALCMVEVFGFALNFGICQLGIKAITSGGTVTIFLFGLVFAVPIRKWGILKQIEQQKERYFTMTIKVIGLVILIVLWPSFASTTANVDVAYLLLVKGSISTDNNLINQAYLHTFLCFLSCICTSLGLRISGQKLQINKFIQTLVNTGIFISTSASIIIDPFASLFMGVLGPVLLFLLQKYGSAILLSGYPIDSIIMAVLGGIFSSIFAAGRNSRTLSLSSDSYAQGGYQFAAIFVTAGFAFIFGLIATAILRCLSSPNQSSNKDSSTYLIDQQTLPIYPDDPILQKIMNKNIDQSLRQQNALFNLKQGYIIQKGRQNVELGKILKQHLEHDSRLR